MHIGIDNGGGGLSVFLSFCHAIMSMNDCIKIKWNDCIKIKWNPGGQYCKNPLYGGNIFLLEKSSTCAAKIHTEFNLLMEKILKITLNKSNAKVFGDEESLSVE